VIGGGARGLGHVELLSQKRHDSRKKNSKRSCCKAVLRKEKTSLCCPTSAGVN